MIKKMYKKNGYSKKKGLFLALLSASLTFSCSMTAFADSNSSYTSSFNSKKYTSCSSTSIGDAKTFAVFAKKYVAKCDMEGNVAVQSISLNGNHVGLSSNVEGNKLSYIEKFESSGCSNEEFLKQDNCAEPLILGNDYSISKKDRWNVDCGNQNFVAPTGKASDIINIKNSSYTIDFDAEFKSLCSISQSLSAMQTTSGTTSNKCNGNGKISCKSGLNILNMTMAEYSSLMDFDIEISANASLVINLTDYNGQNLDNKIKINGNREAYKGLSSHVMWNFGKYNKTVSFSETTMGCILAPSAKVEIHSSHNGNVIADTVENNGGEIHKNDFEGVTSDNETPINNTETPAPSAEASSNDQQPATTTEPQASNSVEAQDPATTDDSASATPASANPSSKENKKIDKSPQTGDNSMITVCVVVAVLSAGAGLTVLKLRKNKTV